MKLGYQEPLEGPQPATGMIVDVVPHQVEKDGETFHYARAVLDVYESPVKERLGITRTNVDYAVGAGINEKTVLGRLAIDSGAWEPGTDLDTDQLQNTPVAWEFVESDPTADGRTFWNVQKSSLIYRKIPVEGGRQTQV